MDPATERSRPRVFVSRPSALSDRQRELERACFENLAQLGFRPVVVRREHYAREPWPQLRRAVAAAHGALILGFRQVRLTRAVWKPETPEAAAADGWFATPWNQLEAGLTIMARLPTLVVPEDGVAEGIFGRGSWGAGVHAAAMALWASTDASADPSVRAWTSAVRDRALEPAPATTD